MHALRILEYGGHVSGFRVLAGLGATPSRGGWSLHYQNRHLPRTMTPLQLHAEGAQHKYCPYPAPGLRLIDSRRRLRRVTWCLQAKACAARLCGGAATHSTVSASLRTCPRRSAEDACAPTDQPNYAGHSKDLNWKVPCRPPRWPRHRQVAWSGPAHFSQRFFPSVPIARS